MVFTSLTYSRSAKVADPINKFENHDVNITATIQGTWNNEVDVTWDKTTMEAVNEPDEAMAELKDWVLKHIREDVKQIRGSG